MGPESITGVCEVEVIAGKATPSLLIEVPHGATRSRHFEQTRRQLVGEFPDDLQAFFHVNTDVGSIEVARFVAQMIAEPAAFPELPLPADGAAGGTTAEAVGVVILRGLIPRTFVDCNRVLTDRPSGEVKQGITPGLPSYITRDEDIRSLTRMHQQYQAVAVRAYQSVCRHGGKALILHTYAPRSVEIDRVDGEIVTALRKAYEPELYDRWERRPDVDVISEDADGVRLAPEGLVERLREAYSARGIHVAENRTYRLFPGTMGYRHSKDYPGRVACIEINRALLVREFKPFEEMRIDPLKARRMAAPIAAALLATP